MIVHAKYNDLNNQWIKVTLEDGISSKVSVKDGIRRRFTIALDEYLKNGGTIEPFETKEEHSKRVEQESKIKRDKLLKKGTLTKDKKLWFNLETAQMFVQKVSVIEEGETMLWKDANRKVIKLSKEVAKAYSKEIVSVLDVVYGLTQNKGIDNEEN